MVLRNEVNAERAARLATIVNVGSPLLLVASLIFTRGNPRASAELLAIIAAVDFGYYVWVEFNNV
jgi:hypothetical protein